LKRTKAAETQPAFWRKRHTKRKHLVYSDASSGVAGMRGKKSAFVGGKSHDLLPREDPTIEQPISRVKLNQKRGRWAGSSKGTLPGQFLREDGGSTFTGRQGRVHPLNFSKRKKKICGTPERTQWGEEEKRPKRCTGTGGGKSAKTTRTKDTIILQKDLDS